VIKNGKFEGPANGAAATSPDITFTTAGYTGTAETYYEVVKTGAAKPAPGAYTGSLGALAAGDWRKTVTLPGTDGDGYDVYVMLFKDGKTSAPLKINTKDGEAEVGGEWGTGRFVAVAFNSDKAAWSADGAAWTEAALPSVGNNAWRNVTYGGGRCVATASSSTPGSDKAVWSVDGTSWTEAAMPFSADWQSVTYGGGRFVAVPSWTNDKAAWSSNGASWTKATTTPAGDWYSVTFGNSKFVAVNVSVMSNGSIGGAMYSTNGSSWTAGTLPATG
jgi:hypothetical protein